VLIAVPETAWAKRATPIRQAVPTAAGFHAFLERRFPGSAIELVAPAPGRPVTKAAVLAAFEAARPAPGELFVVLFFGHGIPATGAHPYRSWALTADELTGPDLAGELQALPAGVDIVVISTCCYVRGIDHAGPDVPMVCISAAGIDRVGGGIVLRSMAPQLVKEIEAAAERGETYGALEERFRRRRFAGREFRVDARPPERLDCVVLGT
jgi:hypothetical protein